MNDLRHRTTFIGALTVRNRVKVRQHAHTQRQIAVHRILTSAREVLPGSTTIAKTKTRSPAVAQLR